MKSDISGFPEFLPNEQIAFNKIVDAIRERFELHGFSPLDTAAVERISTLLAKGNDNEIYGLYRLADEKSKKDLGLRFDLTVPLARYVVANSGKLIFPYKRYQISPVWRGERPQYGRYRQFYQCDIDVIGVGDLSIEHDAEIVAIITEVLSSLDIPNFHTKLNNRKILSGFLKTVVAEKKIDDLIRLIDKIDKISPEEFDESLKKMKISQENVTKLKNFLNMTGRGDNFNILKRLRTFNFNEEFTNGVMELISVFQILKKLGIEDRQVKISTGLARGLTYYTGTIFETTFDEDLNDIGSISGGGRYDNLTTTLSDKIFPGVGATIGISRLVIKLIEKGLLNVDKFSPATVLVTVQNHEFVGSYMKIANKLREAGIKTETYLQNKSLGVQLNYASRKGYNFVIIANELELLEGKAIFRNLNTKEQIIIRTEYVGKEILKLLAQMH
ncbi:MAG: histidine--tRNA ligase [Holosporaceae bacterium]|jgi:histidyl-tRNA synthetase|nr:histidine--tRNA ligase [Holosporaceae bacterium]